jgi:phosphate transport system protein
MPSDHTLHVLDADLAAVTGQVIRLAGLTEDILERALKAALEGYDDLVDAVVRGDVELDQLTADIEKASIRIFALRQPRADDLRRPVSAMKIAMNLERCGDLAKNIAKRGRLLWRLDHQGLDPAPIKALAAKVAGSISLLKAAYAERDLPKVLAVWHGDAEIDGLYDTVSSQVLSEMTANPQAVEAGMHLLFIAKNLERIGDHATNIAELIHYELVGAGPPRGRPKNDPLDDPLLRPPPPPLPTNK